MDFTGYGSGSIFTPQELTALEQQLNSLFKAAKEARTVCKDESFKLSSAFEAEVMSQKQTASKNQQSHASTTTTTTTGGEHKVKIGDCLGLMQEIIRQTDDVLVDDMNFLDDQMKLVRKIKNSNDHWAQLELKTILGEDVIDTEALNAEIAEKSNSCRDSFLELMTRLRAILDEGNVDKLYRALKRVQNGEPVDQDEPEPEPLPETQPQEGPEPQTQAEAHRATETATEPVSHGAPEPAQENAETPASPAREEQPPSGVVVSDAEGASSAGDVKNGGSDAVQEESGQVVDTQRDEENHSAAAESDPILNSSPGSSAVQNAGDSNAVSAP
eukprot:ANDGO_01458.mRNA.1 hypothetical protein